MILIYQFGTTRFKIKFIRQNLAFIMRNSFLVGTRPRVESSIGMIFPLKYKNLPQNKEIYQKNENIPKNLEIYLKVQKYTKKLKI